jgi:hypothetical protein
MPAFARFAKAANRVSLERQGLAPMRMKAVLGGALRLAFGAMASAATPHC